MLRLPDLDHSKLAVLNRVLVGCNFSRLGGRKRVKIEGVKKTRDVAGLFLCVLLSGCAAKKQPAAATPPPSSELPPPTAETIQHCVVTKQENANTVTCNCEPAITRIDSKTGHITLVCKKMKEKK